MGEACRISILMSERRRLLAFKKCLNVSYDTRCEHVESSSIPLPAHTGSSLRLSDEGTDEGTDERPQCGAESMLAWDGAVR